MKNIKKKLILAVLTAVLFTTAIPVYASTDESESSVYHAQDERAEEVSALDELINTEYYEKLLNWFDEKDMSEEEQTTLLNDSEFIKDVMRDSFWEEPPEECTASARALTFPIAGYGDGTYFSNNRAACTHHSDDNCSLSGSCGCRSYNSSIQCAGFGKLVYWAKKGSDYTSSDYVAGLSESNWSTSKIKNYFYTSGKITVGSYVRLIYSSGEEHSFIVTSISSTGIGIYDCNYYYDNCEVDLRTQTWSQLESAYTEIMYTYTY